MKTICPAKGSLAILCALLLSACEEDKMALTEKLESEIGCEFDTQPTEPSGHAELQAAITACGDILPVDFSGTWAETYKDDAATVTETYIIGENGSLYYDSKVNGKTQYYEHGTWSRDNKLTTLNFNDDHISVWAATPEGVVVYEEDSLDDADLLLNNKKDGKIKISALKKLATRKSPNGIWMTGCHTNAQGEYSSSSLQIKDDKWIYSSYLYQDAECIEFSRAMNTVSRVEHEQTITLPDGNQVTKKQSSITEAALSPLSQSNTALLKHSRLCGISRWKKGKVKDITHCRELGYPGTDIYYDIYKIEDNVLYLGSSHYGNGLTPETSPSKLNYDEAFQLSWRP